MQSTQASFRWQARRAPDDGNLFWNARSLFGEAIDDCHELLHRRQQSVAIDETELDDIASRDHGRLARLVARALGDVASVSRRGGSLSLGSARGAVVIRGSHPLDIPGEGLPINQSLRLLADQLHVTLVMNWDQGRGPRLTLSLPSAVVDIRSHRPGRA